MDDKRKRLLNKEKYTFDDLVLIMEILRSENGCPWDREQTHLSIRENLIEETYEVIEGIDTDNEDLIKEELGDVLFQIVFHARMEEEQGKFDITDVIDGISRKMICRHPHVFSDRTLETSAEVLDAWDQIKAEEKRRNTLADKLNSIPMQFPALVRANKVCEKARKANVARYNAVSALTALSNDLAALKENQTVENAEKKIGRLLFTITAMAEEMGVSSERALTYTTNEFLKDLQK